MIRLIQNAWQVFAKTEMTRTDELGERRKARNAFFAGAEFVLSKMEGCGDIQSAQFNHGNFRMELEEWKLRETR